MAFSGTGAGAGALQGASYGSVAGPWGAAIGAGIGLLSGGFGAGAEQDAAHQSYKDEYKQLKDVRRLYDQEWQDSAPARTTLARIAARAPDQLDPYQQRMMDDAARQSQAGMAASGSRGNPRAVSASFDSLNRAREELVHENRGEQLGVAGTLAGRGFQAHDAFAGTQEAIGQARAARDTGQGAMTADLIGTAGGAAMGFGTGMAGGYGGYGTGAASPFGQLGNYLSNAWKTGMAPSTPTTLYPSAAPSTRNSLGRLSGPV